MKFVYNQQIGFIINKSYLKLNMSKYYILQQHICFIF